MGSSSLMELNIASVGFVHLTCLLQSKTMNPLFSHALDLGLGRNKIAYTSKNFDFRKRHTIFLGLFHDSTSSILCSLDMQATGEVLLTRCNGKGSKYFFFSLWRCWQTAFFIILRQAFLIVASLVSITNFAYSEGRNWISKTD